MYTAIIKQSSLIILFIDPTVSASSASTENEDCTVECSSGFYCSNNTCNPDCRSWEQDSHHVVVAVDVVVIISGCIGVITSVAVFIVAGIRRKHV